jgi:hypothetical protein
MMPPSSFDTCTANRVSRPMRDPGRAGDRSYAEAAGFEISHSM